MLYSTIVRSEIESKSQPDKLSLLPDTKTLVVLDFGYCTAQKVCNNDGTTIKPTTIVRFRSQTACGIKQSTYEGIIRGQIDRHNGTAFGKNNPDIHQASKQLAGRFSVGYDAEPEQAQGQQGQTVNQYFTGKQPVFADQENRGNVFRTPTGTVILFLTNHGDGR